MYSVYSTNFFNNMRCWQSQQIDNHHVLDSNYVIMFYIILEILLIVCEKTPNIEDKRIIVTSLEYTASYILMMCGNNSVLSMHHNDNE